MRHFVLLLLTYAAFVLNTVGGPVSFLALVVVAALAMCEGTAVLFWAAATGFLSDCLTSGWLGIDVLIFTAVALTADWLCPANAKRSVWGLCGVSFLVVATTQGGSTLLHQVAAGSFSPPVNVVEAAVRSGASSAGLVLAVLLIGPALTNVLPSSVRRRKLAR